MPRHYHVTEDQVFAIFVEEEKKVSQGSAPLSNSFPAIKSLLCCEQLSDLHKEALKSSYTCASKMQKLSITGKVVILQ